MFSTTVFKSKDALVFQALELLRTTLPRAGNLMLSGGTTPYAVYNRLAATPCPVHPSRRLFLSDERMVPKDSEQNNAHNLMPMLRALGCEDRFIQVDTELPPKEAAAKFATDLQPLEKVDLGFLGMGADGHTAGIFSLEQAGQKKGALALHTPRPDGMEGVSTTPAFFQRVERIVLIVTGEEKRAAIETLLHAPQSIPAGIALSGHPKVELWTDLENRS
jgi:6-phosphogluconolactonase/glucosamine-6-phosphate isomerase/deaminase